MVKLWRNTVHLLLEVNIFYFFILLMYLDSGTLPSMLSVLLPVAISIFIFEFLSGKLPSTYVSIMLIGPILAIFPFLTSYSLGLSLIIGFFISFRSFMHIVEERPLSTFVLLIISFIWMPFVYAGGVLVEYPHGLTLMVLFGMQLLLVVMLYSGTAVLNLKGNAYMQKRVMLTTTMVVGGILAAAIFFSTLGKWVITFVLSFFGQGVSQVFNFLSRPIFYLLGLHDWTPKSKAQLEEGGIADGETEGVELVNVDPNMDNPLFIGIVVFITLIILYLLLNKRKVIKKKAEQQAEEQYRTTMSKIGGSWFPTRKRQKPPEDEVRKLMFDLEQLAIKKNRGRFANETLEEWIKRETTFNKDFIALYAKVRYGELSLSPEEVEACKHMAKEIREVMKQWKKAS
ncbi:hypothetical protein FIU87_10050 [Bacillus sp. THAF10]|uniref:hypothetical protein n=1 Tax=Bacillus sp. THAF10 TaxID=2587848 RepID=UPI0012695549|nr:hypothetical protein [Bacillus sp. THAF10]QFT88988.1 hypothetical protein FIU87_10050 [Bacillus sp. THAF10]